jgi:hypothetical protein
MTDFDFQSEDSTESSVRSPNNTKQRPFWVTFGFLLSIAVLGIPFYLADFPVHWQQQWDLYLGIILGEMAYLIVGFLFQPQPDTDDMGWLGGLVNNPLRITDDINRFLYILKILLLPGRLMARAILNFITLIAENR